MWLEEEDTKWRQRAKQNWYQLGNQNIRFFHTCATQRCKRNHILHIRNQAGFVVSTLEEVNSTFHEYFQQLFTTSRPTSEEIQCAIKCGQRKISSEMNGFLLSNFTKEEVERTLNQMAPSNLWDPMASISVSIKSTGTLLGMR